MATKFCTADVNIWASPVRGFPHATSRAPKTMRCSLDFLRICVRPFPSRPEVYRRRQRQEEFKIHTVQGGPYGRFRPRLCLLFVFSLSVSGPYTLKGRCAPNRKVAGSIPDGVIGIFIDIILRSHYCAGVDSASNRNFLGVKSGRWVRLTTLPPSWAIVT